MTIGVVDDGLEYTHPDLMDAYISTGSYDFNDNDPDPFPSASSDDHGKTACKNDRNLSSSPGTSAAGVAGARDNSVCGVGSAFREEF